jgi:hypothetical protein
MTQLQLALALPYSVAGAVILNLNELCHKMNEQFKVLYNQARDFYLQDESLECSTRELHELIEQKFVESIVKKMLQTCEDHPTWSGRAIGEQIKQHFGIY